MPPRDPNMPEGTDSIIDGTADLGGSSSGFGGTSGGTGSGSSFMDDDEFGSSASGSGSLSGSAGSFSSDANTGFGASTSPASPSVSSTSSAGMTSSSVGAPSSSIGSAASSVGDAASSAANSVDVQSLKAQASDKVRDVASQGKERATEALTNVTQMIKQTADTVDERLGQQYGDYVRRAATAVEGLGTSIQGKEVDELFDDARNFVRKSPAVALGAAAAIGFLLVRLVKSGMPPAADGDDYRSSDDYAGASTQRLASPPRIDNSYDPVA